MTFTRAKPGGWQAGERLTSGQANHIDEQLAKAIDGNAGGSYAPSSPILIGGAGIRVPAPSHVDQVTPKAYVDDLRAYVDDLNAYVDDLADADTWTPAVSNASGITDITVVYATYQRIKNIVHCHVGINVQNTTQVFAFRLTLPISRGGNFSGSGQASGVVCGIAQGADNICAGHIESVPGTERILVLAKTSASTAGEVDFAVAFSFEVEK